MTKNYHETCKWYVSVDIPECGVTAPYQVKVKGQVFTALVPLCEGHKKIHDENFARIRKAHEVQTD